MMRWGLIAAALLMAFGAFARSPQRELVTFSVTTNVGYGNEVFIVGNHEDVGNWDPTRGAKLVWHTNNVWSATLGIQSGTALDYKPVAMPNSYTGICNPANANWMPPGGGNHLTTNSPAEPDAPYVGKAMYYHTSWTNVVLIYSPDGTNFSTAPMTKIGPGRVSGESLFFINGIGEAGGSLQFIPYDGGTNFDHAPYGGYGGGDYFTSLDVFFLQDGNVFNYRPPATVSAPRIIWTNAVSTFPPSPNRKMGIYLPRGYDQNTWKRYPVVYMHDGENIFYPSNGLSGYGWEADRTATKEIGQGRMREVIIVGLASTANRTREYLPPEDTSGGQGFGDTYSKFLVYDVKAKMDALFRTLPDANNTATIGSSSGGLITTYLGWHTNVFGLIGPFSPAYLISSNFNNRIKSEPWKPLRIFTETGNIGYPETAILPDTWTILSYFIEKGYVQNRDLISRVGCGDSHSEAAWQKWLPDCFRFLLNLWDEPNLLAKELYPPTITNLTADAVGFMTQAQERYRIEETSDLLAGNWSGVSTSSFQAKPWANFSLPGTLPTNGNNVIFRRVVAE